MKKYMVSFSGAVDVEAENEKEAIEKVSNEDILNSVQYDEVNEAEQISERFCEGCGESILEGQAVVKGKDRHSACA